MRIARYSIIFPILALYLYLAGSAPFLGQWDTFDYLKQIVSHQLSDLGLGRPVFIGYNILLWEAARRIFNLDVLKVEMVVMVGTVALGVAGVIIFQKLARQFLSPSGTVMATLGLLISPVYAIYSGFIMTEVPMLVALMAAALVLWKYGERHPATSAVLGGTLFGVAVGIREQALTMGAAFLWILFSRRQSGYPRLHSIFLFGCAAVFLVLAPVLGFYLQDPAGFVRRIGIWLNAIPMGQIQFWNNVQASLLYTLLVCPGAWLALAGAGVYLLFRPRNSKLQANKSKSTGLIPNPVWGFICCIVLPVVVLWRDADVQIHPRYLMPVLPASLIMCTSLYSRWTAAKQGRTIWALVHVLVFGLALVIVAPIRHTQIEKMQFAEKVRDAIPGKALIIAGGYSPMLDYYRGIGLRPEWQILWSGWDWKAEKAESMIRDSWAHGTPVYLSDEPSGWRYFESEYLHLHNFLKDRRREPILPQFSRVYPR